MWILLFGCRDADTDLPEVADAPDSACVALGCLRSETSLGTFTRADIAPFLSPGIELDNGYEVVVIAYATRVGPATATVTLPVDDVTPVSAYPVVVNAHGTIGLDDPCRLSGTLSGTGLAALFGGRGAIGVAPDYPGLGTPGFHAYLDAASEGESTLDAVRAAVHLARYRGVPTNERAAVVGMSQGGHAVLAAASLHQEYAPELDIRAFGAAAPASVYEEHWRGGVTVPGPHLVMHAMLAWSFSQDRTGLWADDIADTVDAHLTTRCLWSPAFVAEPLLTDDFPTVAEAVFSAAFLDEYTRGDWSRFAAMGEGFVSNRIRPWDTQTAPIALWQGTDDTTVLPFMTEALVQDLRSGGLNVDLHVVPGATHTDTAFGFLAWPEKATDESVAWVQSMLAD